MPDPRKTEPEDPDEPPFAVPEGFIPPEEHAPSPPALEGDET